MMAEVQSMGVAVFIAVEREFAGYDPCSVMGKPLAAAIEPLDTACERLGVPTLSSFVSADPAELEEFASDEPPLTLEQARDQLAALRKSGGVDAELLNDLEALTNLTEGADLSAPPLPEQWFEPEAALVPVRALLAWIRDSEPTLMTEPFTRDDVIMDLQSVEEVLGAASRANVRFHFAYEV